MLHVKLHCLICFLIFLQQKERKEIKLKLVQRKRNRFCETNRSNLFRNCVCVLRTLIFSNWIDYIFNQVFLYFYFLIFNVVVAVALQVWLFLCCVFITYLYTCVKIDSWQEFKWNSMELETHTGTFAHTLAVQQTENARKSLFFCSQSLVMIFLLFVSFLVNKSHYHNIIITYERQANWGPMTPDGAIRFFDFVWAGGDCSITC